MIKLVNFQQIDFLEAQKKQIREKKILFFSQKDIYYNIGKQKSLLIAKDNNLIKIKVPKDFYSNGLTVPFFLKFFINPIDDKYSEASFYHDYLYFNNKGFTRYEIDNIFKQILEVCNVNFITRNIFYLTVRMFGWCFFTK